MIAQVDSITLLMHPFTKTSKGPEVMRARVMEMLKVSRHVRAGEIIEISKKKNRRNANDFVNFLLLFFAIRNGKTKWARANMIW